MSQPPTFSFGSTSKSITSTGSSNPGTAGDIRSKGFGGGNSTISGSGFSFAGFGTPATASKAEEQRPLFGSTAGDKTKSLFAEQPSKPGENSMTSPIPSPFSGFGKTLQTPAKSTGGPNDGASQAVNLVGKPPANTGPSTLFGSSTTGAAGSTTPAPAPGAPLFGGPSTTPAGPPPTSGTFGASTGGTGGSGLFNLGGGSGQQSGSLFEVQPPTQDQGQSSFPSSNTHKVNLFGAPPSASSNAFGTQALQNSSGLFSNATKEPQGNPLTSSTPSDGQKKPLFGFGLSSSTIPTSMPSLFAKDPVTSQAAPALTGTASATTQAPPKLFGKPLTTNLTTPSLFATAPSTNQTTQSSFGAAAATSQPAPSLFSQPTMSSSEPRTSAPSFSFLSQSASTSTPVASNATASTAPTGKKPLFAGLGTLSTASTTASVPAIQSLAPSFGGNQNNATPQPVASPATAGATKPTQTAFAAIPDASMIALSASISGPAPPIQSRLRNKTMDEILTRWASDLTKYAKEFKGHAETVARWDQMLVDNMAKISKLYAETVVAEKQTASVEMQLSAVENQQNELESWLAKYEAEVDEMMAKNGPAQSELGGPDQEREGAYKLAERLGERLEDMNRDLESMIEEVNGANASLSKGSKPDEPVTQIVRILNAHLTQLQAIDQGTSILQGKVTAAQRSAQGIAQMGGGHRGHGGVAVEDFYRSYMGRR